MNRDHGYVSSTPVTDGEHVYVFFGKTGILCFDMHGQQIWQQSVGTNTDMWGSASSPVLYPRFIRYCLLCVSVPLWLKMKCQTMTQDFASVPRTRCYHKGKTPRTSGASVNPEQLILAARSGDDAALGHFWKATEITFAFWPGSKLAGACKESSMHPILFRKRAWRRTEISSCSKAPTSRSSRAGCDRFWRPRY